MKTISEPAISNDIQLDAKETHGVATSFPGWTECAVPIWKSRSVSVESNWAISTRTLRESDSHVLVLLQHMDFNVTKKEVQAKVKHLRAD